MPDGPAHYNPDDFARLRPVEDTHFWFVSRNDILAAALSTLPTNGSVGDCVLEIGCGTGNTLRVLREGRPHATVIGMDALHAGLLHAQSRAHARLVEGRVEDMPFGTDFALIGMFDVLEHIEDDVAALRAVRQSLAPKGQLLMTVPAAPSLWSRYDEESQHHRSVQDAHDDRPTHQRRVRAFGRPGWLQDLDAPHGLVPPVRANLQRSSRPGNGSTGRWTRAAAATSAPGATGSSMSRW